MCLHSSVGRASHRYFAEVTGSNPVEALIFSGFFFPIAKISTFTAMIILHFHLNSSTAIVQIWSFSYILYNFSFVICFTDQANQVLVHQLPSLGLARQ